MRANLCVGLLTACLCGRALGDAPKSPAVLPGSIEFTGSFDCLGAFSNGKVHRATFTGQLILQGTWIELLEADVEPATGYIAKYLIGSDNAGSLVEFDANNFGAARYTSAEGWKDEKLTMVSEMSSDAKQPYAVNRFVYTVTGHHTFSVDWEVSKGAEGPWKPSDHLACASNDKKL